MALIQGFEEVSGEEKHLTVDSLGICLRRNRKGMNKRLMEGFQGRRTPREGEVGFWGPKELLKAVQNEYACTERVFEEIETIKK